jgi:hypothetical protein
MYPIQTYKVSVWFFARLLTSYRSDNGLDNGPTLVTYMTCNCVVQECILNIYSRLMLGCTVNIWITNYPVDIFYTVLLSDK